MAEEFDEFQRDIREVLREFLSQWGLENLMGFVEDALSQGWSQAEILARLREAPEYKLAFPENDLRREAGLTAWSESQILEYRNAAKRLAQDVLGIGDLRNDEIAKLIGKGVDLGQWERRLQAYASLEQWGPAVKEALSQELGYPVPDERVWAMISPDIPTPELDAALQSALMRGMPAVLGFGMRPEEEADLLREYGLNPEEAFKGFQGIASELPRAERLTAIEAYINTNQSQFPPIGEMFGDEASYGTLFRAIQLRDPEAITRLQGLMSREAARWQAGGGPAGQGTRKLGLLTAGQRQGE